MSSKVLRQSKSLLLDEQNYDSMKNSEVLLTNNHATFNPQSRYNRQNPIRLPSQEDELVQAY